MDHFQIWGFDAPLSTEALPKPITRVVRLVISFVASIEMVQYRSALVGGCDDYYFIDSRNIQSNIPCPGRVGTKQPFLRGLALATDFLSVLF
jgi:hypothetical protein